MNINLLKLKTLGHLQPMDSNSQLASRESDRNIYYKDLKMKAKRERYRLGQQKQTKLESLGVNPLKNPMTPLSKNRELFLNRSRSNWNKGETLQKLRITTKSMNVRKYGSSQKGAQSDILEQERLQMTFSLDPSTRNHLDKVKSQTKKEILYNQNNLQDLKGLKDDLKKKLETSMQNYKKAFRQDLRYQSTYVSPLVKELRMIRRAEVKKLANKIGSGSAEDQLKHTKNVNNQISGTMIRLDDLAEDNSVDHTDDDNRQIGINIKEGSRD